MEEGPSSNRRRNVKRILSMLGEEEFKEELTLGRKLESLGILDEDKLNYTLFLLEVLAAKRDPYPRKPTR